MPDHVYRIIQVTGFLREEHRGRDPESRRPRFPHTAAGGLVRRF